MKILQINCVYRKGSTGKITDDIHKGLIKRGINSIVCYGRGQYIKETNVYKVCAEKYSKINHFISRITGIMYGGCILSTKYLLKIIKTEKPDIVHLQCINGYFVNIYRLINWLKKNDIKTVITLHAEFMYTGGCGYSLDCVKWKSKKGCQKCPRWKSETESFFVDRTHKMWLKMRNAFSGFENNLLVVSVSPWLSKRAMQTLIFCENRHEVVLNGVNTRIFHPYNTEQLKKKHKVETCKIIFYATPYFNLNPEHLKGGHYVIELAKKMEEENVKFIIAGSYDKDCIVPSNVILLGNILDQKALAKYYSMADVTLLTSKRETFSMVTVESLSCGTPVVGFKAGAPEMIAIPEYTTFVDYGDLDSLYRVLHNYFLHKKESRIAENAKKLYSKDIMVDHYVQIYKRLLSEE